MGFWTIAGTIVAVLLIADVIIRLTFMRLVAPMIEKVPAFNVKRAAPHPAGEAITFSGENGLQLTGSIYRVPDGQPRGIVVFCPEYDGNHWQAMYYAEALTGAGFAMLAFDFRNQGESDCDPGYQPLHWATEFEVEDLNTAIDFVRSMPEFAGLPLGLYGISRGGITALCVAGRRSDISHVAIQSSGPIVSLLLFYGQRWAELYMPRWMAGLLPMWHLKSTLALARWLSAWRRGCRYVLSEAEAPRLRNKKTLIIAGRRDSYIKPEVIKSLAQRIGKSCEVWLVDNAKHNAAGQADPDEYDRRLVEFFESMVPAVANHV